MSRFRQFDAAFIPTTFECAGVKWDSGHSSGAHAKIAGWLELSVQWSMDQKNDPGWIVSVAGRRLKRRGESRDEACKLAVIAARQWLAKAAAALPPE